ncbi:MAG: HdeD family acid-resistance protein [Paraclostridium sp.]|uniref:HdeD family acid-resistance protein n=1 Tax=Paraclostridium sp. TaxID=2023273 RepID=UPI003F31AAFC
MTIKTISPFTILFSAFASFILGLVVLFQFKFIANITLDIISIIFIVLGISSILTYVFNKNHRLLSKIIVGIFYMIFAIFINFNPIFLGISIVRIIGIYAFLNFIARFIAATVLFKNKVKGWIRGIIVSFLSLIFSIILIFHPQEYMYIVAKIAGIYIILYSFTLFADFLKEISYEDILPDKFKRKIRIGLPILYAAFIPQHLLEKINESIKINPNKNIFVEKKDSDIKDIAYSTVDIFIHLAPNCANGFGHIDISFENITYSYGTYDSSSNRLFTLISDGVLVEADTSKYIEFLTTQCNRSLIGFTLALNTAQHKAIKTTIEKMKSNCFEWKCDIQNNPNKRYTDETNLMYLATKCTFYKFKQGYFKTYFTLTSNCVRLADTIVGSAGLDLIAVNGIITPGTYYNYLDGLFKRKNTIVIKKKVYRKDSV